MPNFSGFDLPSFVDKAFKDLFSDVSLSSEVTIGTLHISSKLPSDSCTIGDYTTNLEYTQVSVPTVTDDSLNFLLPMLAQPIVQKIVTGALLGYV